MTEFSLPVDDGSPLQRAMMHALEDAHRVHFQKLVPEHNLPRAHLPAVACFDKGWSIVAWKEAVGSTLVSHYGVLSEVFTCSSVVWNVSISVRKIEVEDRGRDWFEMWRHYAMCSLTLDVLVIEIKREVRALIIARVDRLIAEMRAGIEPSGVMTWKTWQKRIGNRRIERQET